MIIFSTKIIAHRFNKKEILEIFSNVKGPVEAKTGCMSTSIYRVHTNEDLIVYQEVWKNKEFLEKHVRSNLFKKILVAIDMSCRPPDILFNTISKTEGMELIRKTLGF